MTRIVIALCLLTGLAYAGPGQAIYAARSQVPATGGGGYTPPLASWILNGTTFESQFNDGTYNYFTNAYGNVSRSGYNTNFFWGSASALSTTNLSSGNVACRTETHLLAPMASPASYPILAAGSWSMSGWFWTTSLAANDCYMERAVNYMLLLHGGKLCWYSGGYNDTTFTMPSATWTHLAVTYNAANGGTVIYANGNQVLGYTNSITWAANDEIDTMGRRDNAFQPVGAWDDYYLRATNMSAANVSTESGQGAPNTRAK